MNVVKEINKINQLELDLGISGASWHDEYKDSAYIFVGGLHFDLTEGDVITIFSQQGFLTHLKAVEANLTHRYGEVMDLNMPRDKETGKPKGFGFLMYEDQRSTVLAVDNLNGAKVLDKTLRVDHVKNYKQPKIKGEDGEWVEPEEQSLNAKPEMIMDDGAVSDSSATSLGSIDPEDPMRDYLLAKRKEEKALKKTTKSKSKSKRKKDETPEERRARKARRKEKKARKTKSEGMKGVEDLLNSLGRRDVGKPPSPSSPRVSRRSRSRDHSRVRNDDREDENRPRYRHEYGVPNRRSIQSSDDERRDAPNDRESRSRRNRDYD